MLKMGEDFRGFLNEMEETQEGGFIRIKKAVDRRYEAAAIVKKLEQERKVPLIIFENIKASHSRWRSTVMEPEVVWPEHWVFLKQI